MKYAALGGDAALALQYDILAISSLSQLKGGFLPWTSSALRPSAIQIALNDIAVNRRRVILELGSGLSTVYVAAALARLGGRLITIDHDESWQMLVRSWLTPDEVAATSFIQAPLVSTTFDEQPVLWYDAKTILAVLEREKPVDLLLVDGPPAYFHERCLNRGPAIEALQHRLAPSTTVILDDIDRQGEQHIARCWSKRLGYEARYLTVEAGVALWTLGHSNNISQ